jgi:DNA repair exonuclease SbcCD ATPase subunit
MSFLSRIFGQKKEAGTKEKPSLEQAERTAREKLSGIDCAPAVQICEKLKNQVGAARKSITALRGAAIPAEIDPRLKSAARESREQVAIWLEGLLNDISFPKKQDFGAFLALRQNLNSALFQLTKGNPKHGYYTSTVFKNEMAAIGKNIGELNALAGRLAIFLDSAVSENAVYKTFVDLIETRRVLEKELKDARSQVDELRRASASASENTASLRKKLESAPKADEGALIELQARKAQLEGEIYSLLAPLSRPLKKYANMGAFEKKRGALVEDYINDPVKTALGDKSGEFKEILSEIDRLIRSGQMDLKENVSEKTLAVVAKAKEGGLETLVASHAMTCSEITENETKKRPLIEKVRQLEVELNSASAQSEATSASLGIVENTLKQKEQLLGEIENKIQAALEQMPAG